MKKDNFLLSYSVVDRNPLEMRSPNNPKLQWKLSVVILHYTASDWLKIEQTSCCWLKRSSFQFVPKVKTAKVAKSSESEDSSASINDLQNDLTSYLGTSLIDALEKATMDDLRTLADILGVTYQVCQLWPIHFIDENSLIV